MVTSGYAPVNGLNIYYEVMGEGRPLVLLHGGILSIEMFDGIRPVLAKNRQVIALELQGHGRTADSDREISLAQFADDVVGVLDHLGIPQADFFGFSLGAGTAFQTALDHPDRVGKAVVASVAFNPSGNHPDLVDPARQATSDRMPTMADFEEMRSAYERLSPEPGHFDEFMAKVSAKAAALEGWTPEEIRSVTAPTLVLVGDRDFWNLDHIVEVYEQLPNAQLGVLPGTTHMSIVRNADVLLPILEAFFD